jgi:hypothetical protein
VVIVDSHRGERKTLCSRTGLAFPRSGGFLSRPRVSKHVTELDDGNLEAWFWRRHANPRSGWLRVPVGAVIVYAVYRRDARLLAGALVWTVCNPFVFPPPETDEAWMTRAVLAERWWVWEEGNGTVGLPVAGPALRRPRPGRRVSGARKEFRHRATNRRA